MKKFLIIILFLLLGLFWLKILYIVPYSNYTITDQTGKVKLKDYPELKEVSFLYSTDLYIEYTEPINLELEKINFRVNDEVIGTAEINRNINELEDFAEPYINEKTKEKSIRKKYVLQKEFLRILGKRNEKYKLGTGTMEGRFYIDIYVKDLKTNKTFIIKRDNIFIYYESAGLKLFLPSV
ncbi:hypothetical protein [Fusobacterium pseudoperiodonticum]|uniref:hypothetical protein n=1 Tax=Fusobacterium pseudoperiodonticum TaxID=2663009 RepID=UPI000C1BAD8B|nr:hypothetical protein [Fusobacterium pseudoperiodonticum]ATV63354.1 hypothetical protein CTM78_02405 [Fusobacterium pseudoperiodonticum]